MCVVFTRTNGVEAEMVSTWRLALLPSRILTSLCPCAKNFCQRGCPPTSLRDHTNQCHDYTPNHARYLPHRLFPVFPRHMGHHCHIRYPHSCHCLNTNPCDELSHTTVPCCLKVSGETNSLISPSFERPIIQYP